MSYTKLGALPPKSEWPIRILPYPSPKFRMDNAGDPFTPTLCNRGPLVLTHQQIQLLLLIGKIFISTFMLILIFLSVE